MKLFWYFFISIIHYDRCHRSVQCNLYYFDFIIDLRSSSPTAGKTYELATQDDRIFESRVRWGAVLHRYESRQWQWFIRSYLESILGWRSSIPRYARTDFRQSKTDGSTKRSSSSVPSLKKVPSSSWKRGDFDVYCAAPVSGCASFASAGNLISLISLNFENVDWFFIVKSVFFSTAKTISISSDFG